MAFTPKFIDMVRNAATVSGSGPVTLGAAVSGFTGIAAALSVGDQFYYCLQNGDRPAEREIGRGTLMPNGVVSRQAVSGALTNFTMGAKSISLVAAAEWFGRMEQFAATPPASGGGPSLLFTGLEGSAVPASTAQVTMRAGRPPGSASRATSPTPA